MDQGGVLLVVIAIGLALLFVMGKLGRRPPEPLLVVGSSPAECVEEATAYMAHGGFVIAHAGATSATFTRPKKPDGLTVVALTFLGIVLLFVGLIFVALYLLYFPVFKPRQTTSVVALAERGGTRVVLSGDDRTAMRDLERWMRENPETTVSST
ncbi:MAG: hypothetical protein M3R38_21115 [Actinomycetota bacterium]|nr:hypothetical protein [Actinomycetota bacterium]